MYSGDSGLSMKTKLNIYEPTNEMFSMIFAPSGVLNVDR